MNPLISKAIGAAFVAWVSHAREKMAENSRSELMDEAELTAVLADVFRKTRRTYISDLGPAVINAFIEGSIESGFGVNKKSVETLAYNYSASIVDYANQMTSLSAAEAYRGIINRKKTPKEAFNFMTNSLGVDRRAVRSLLAMFDSKDQIDNKTLNSMSPSKKKQRMDNYVAAAIELRAKRLGEEESFSAKETSKALVWNLAKVQGVADGQRKRWVTAEDELVCPNCGPMNGQTVELDEKFTLPNKVKVWAPQLHPNCFPSWVPVGSATGIIGADSRWYEGKLVIINTASGREVSVTPNHPVLTDKGWVAAGDLVVGDNLVSYRGNVERKLTSRPDDEGIESPISQVFEAIRESSCVSATRVPVAPEQFHGDGVVDTEVDVVFSDRLLGNDGHPTTLKLPSESKLLLGSVTEGSFLDASSESQLLIGSGTPSNSVVSSTSKLNPVGAAYVSHSVVHSLRSISGGNTGANEPSSDYLPGDVVSSGEFLDALTGLVEFDQVADIRAIDWSGHVYNLQTGGGWYTANSIVVHNCRCKAVIVVRVKNERRKRSRFDRASDLIRKTDNDWETQPRSSDGRFGNRPPGITYRDSGPSSAYTPQPQRQKMPASKVRPKGITYADIDWGELETQLRVDPEWAAIEEMLRVAPEVKVTTKPKDEDVASALAGEVAAKPSAKAVAAKPKPVEEMTLSEYVAYMDTPETIQLSKGITVIPSINKVPTIKIDFAQITPITKIATVAKPTTVASINSFTITETITKPVTVVDLAATVQTEAAKVGVKVAVDTATYELDRPLFAVGFNDDSQMVIPSGNYVTSDTDTTASLLREAYEESALAHIDSVFGDSEKSRMTHQGRVVEVSRREVEEAAKAYAAQRADALIYDTFKDDEMGISYYDHQYAGYYDHYDLNNHSEIKVSEFSSEFDFDDMFKANQPVIAELNSITEEHVDYSPSMGEGEDFGYIIQDTTLDLGGMHDGYYSADIVLDETDFDIYDDTDEVSDHNPLDDSTWDD